MKHERKSKEGRLLERMRSLELRLQAYEQGAQTLIPTEYLHELGTLMHVAYYGVRRAEDTGYLKAQAPRSTGARNPNEGMRLLNLEVSELKRLLERRQQAIRSALEQLDPGVYQRSAVEMEQAGLDQSSQSESWAS